MATINLKWDSAEGATGYKIYQSLDMGNVWLSPIDVGNVNTYIYENIDEDKLILFKLSAYNSVGEIITHWSGAWFDGRRKLPTFALNLGVM